MIFSDQKVKYSEKIDKIENIEIIIWNVDNSNHELLQGMVSVMRFVIAESFDKTEVNHYFEADIPCRIGNRILARSGRVYRVKDIGWRIDTFDHTPNVRVLLTREKE